jgi:hypothetical protein
LLKISQTFLKIVLDNVPGQCYTIIRKGKGDKTMTPIDLTRMSAHLIIDRKDRIAVIEKTVGWGKPVAEIKNIKNTNTTITLTDTGVIVVRDNENMILTAWVASISRAIAIYRTAYGQKKMPESLWLTLNYNNNTSYWKEKVAA